jgi:hypothetical protein
MSSAVKAASTIRLLFTRHSNVAGELHAAGSVADVPERDAEYLVRRGSAVLHEDKAPRGTGKAARPKDAKD